MKLINKYQEGGYLFSMVPAHGKESSSAKSEDAGAKSEPLISDSIMKMVTEKALPSDMRKLLNMLYKIDSLLSITGKVNKKDLYNVKAYVNLIIHLGNYFKKASDEAYNNDAWSEVAIDLNSKLYTINNEGKFLKVGLDDFDIEKQKALTVGELIQLRQENDLFADNTDVVTTIGNAIGTSKIQDYIKNIINTVGSTETSQEAYQDLASVIGSQAARRPTEDQLKVVQQFLALLQLVGPDAIMKVGFTSKSKNVQSAFNYIYGMLPKKMQNQLKANFVTSGGSYEDSNKYVASILSSALDSSNDIKTEESISYPKDLNEDKDKENNRRLNSVELLFNQSLNRQNVLISDPNSRNAYVMSAPGSVIPRLTYDNGDAADNGILSQKLEGKGKGMMKYLNKYNTYLGEEKVNPLTLDQIYYNGDKVANVWLPVDSLGNIDWISFRAHSAAEEIIKDLNITDPILKNKIHIQLGSLTRYDLNGNPSSLTRTKQFLMTNGYTSEANVSSENGLYVPLSSDEESAMNDIIIAEYDKYDSEMNGTGWFKTMFNDIVKVPIFIEIDKNASLNASHYSHKGSLVPDTTIQEDMVAQKAQESPEVKINAGASNLYME